MLFVKIRTFLYLYNLLIFTINLHISMLYEFIIKAFVYVYID